MTSNNNIQMHAYLFGAHQRLYFSFRLDFFRLSCDRKETPLEMPQKKIFGETLFRRNMTVTSSQQKANQTILMSLCRWQRSLYI